MVCSWLSMALYFIFMPRYMFLMVSLWMMGGLLLPGLVQAQNHPCDPPSVIPCHVCGFDTFYGSPPRQLPNGWTGFVLAGDLTFMQDIDTFWGAPALRMWSNGGIFKAGVFTRVRVTPGAGYRAAVFWRLPTCLKRLDASWASIPPEASILRHPPSSGGLCIGGQAASSVTPHRNL